MEPKSYFVRALFETSTFSSLPKPVKATLVSLLLLTFTSLTAEALVMETLERALLDRFTYSTAVQYIRLNEVSLL